MVGGLLDDDNLADEQIAALLSASFAELPTAEVPRRQEILKAISDLCWKVGPRAAGAIPMLIGWPFGSDRETEDAVLRSRIARPLALHRYWSSWRMPLNWPGSAPATRSD